MLSGRCGASAAFGAAAASAASSVESGRRGTQGRGQVRKLCLGIQVQERRGVRKFDGLGDGIAGRLIVGQAVFEFALLGSGQMPRRVTKRLPTVFGL